MSEEELPDSEGIEWTERTGKNGATYRFGAKGIESSTPASPATSTSLPGHVYRAQVDPTVQVKWPVGDNTWKSTSDQLTALGIWRYALLQNGPGSLHEYLLFLSNSNTAKDWRFIDATGQSLDIETPYQQDWNVQFDSPNPTIISVTRLTVRPE